MKLTRGGRPEFDNDCLDEFWTKAVCFDEKMKDLKFIKEHFSFYKDLTEQILAFDPSVSIRINRSQYAFYDDLDIGPFCSFAFFKSNFSLNPLRLKPAQVKDLGCEIKDFDGKKYRMGGSFYVRIYNWDEKALSTLLEAAKRSFLVKEKVGPAAFFQDFKKTKS